MVVSPAKTLDYTPQKVIKTSTEPRSLEHSECLINCLKQLSPLDVSQLMSISDKLAQLNVARYQQWRRSCDLEVSKQAILAFKGDVYTGLDTQSLDEKALIFLHKHLRILSGLYGVLRPLDMMQAYRLEMGTRVHCGDSKNLYEFWGDLITDQLNQDLGDASDLTLVNLASNEYFKVVKINKLKANIITPIFKDFKNDKYKIISFYAKKARGMMVRYAVDHGIENPIQLKDFDYGGYSYSQEQSSANDWVFTRRET